MRGIFTNGGTIASEFGAQSEASRRKNAPGNYFGDVARVLWPRKTAAQLAAIGNVNLSTAKRWMRGDHNPPVEVLIAANRRMFEPR